MKRSTSRCGSLFAIATVLASAWLLVAADDARAGGTVFMTGKNDFGQLGLGDTVNRDVFYAVASPKNVLAAACGSTHAIVATRDGGLYTTGHNSSGQLGIGNNTDKSVFLKVPVLTNVISVAGGFGHSLCCTSDGTCYSTGLNDDGQLGLGDNKSRNTFTKVTSLAGIPIVAVAAGQYHSLALDAFGDVWACGRDDHGQTGVGGTNTFAQVGLMEIIAIACGDNHSMALDIFGDLFTWGANDSGQLGLGFSGVDVGGPSFAETGVVTMAGGGHHSILEKGDGSVWTTGDNSKGQLGLGNNVGEVNFTKVTNPGIHNAVSVGAGQLQSLVAVQDPTLVDAVWTCGSNNFGQLGIALNDHKDRNAFTKNNGVGAAALVRGGENFSMAVNDIPITVQFDVGAVTVQETAATATMVVTLEPPTYSTVTVGYAVTGGTAVAGRDYTFAPGVLTFLPGETRQTITLAVVNDGLSGDNVTVFVSLLNDASLQNASLGSPSTCVVTINNTNPLPTVAFLSNTATGYQNVANPNVQVQLSAAAHRAIQVTCAASSTNAVLGVDYVLTSKTLAIPAGSTLGTFPITLLNSGLPGFNKSIGLTISTPVNATLGTPSGCTLTVVNSQPPTIQFSIPSSSVSESTPFATLTVTLSRAYDANVDTKGTVTVNYAATGGTAIKGVNYILAPGTLTFDFKGGVVLQTIPVSIINDGHSDPDLTAIVALSSPTYGTLGTPATHTLTILDNSPSVLSVQSSGNIDFGTVGVGQQKIIKNAYTIKNLGGGTLHAHVQIDNPPFQVLDVNGVPVFGADFAVPSGKTQGVSLSCVPYTVGPISRTITFSGDGNSLVTTRTASCNGVIQARLTTCPATVLRGTTVNVAWAIDGGTPTRNLIQWAVVPLPTSPFPSNPNVTAQDLTAPYSTWFRAPATPCTVLVRAYAIIGGKTYTSAAQAVSVK